MLERLTPNSLNPQRETKQDDMYGGSVSNSVAYKWAIVLSIPRLVTLLERRLLWEDLWLLQLLVKQIATPPISPSVTIVVFLIQRNTAHALEKFLQSINIILQN
jgi:hypothetical protein